MEKEYTILIIDDKVENLQYLSSILEEFYDIRASHNSKVALKAAKVLNPDLILLDINMPELDGYEFSKLIKEQKSLCEIPIIFISGYEDIEHKVKAFENGGVDYITKPFEAKEVIARVKTQLQISASKKTISKLLEQQDMFIKKIMHEMNTPLSIISLNIDSLEKNLGYQEEFDSIKASTKTLSSIYGDLSYMIKKQSIQYEKKSINLLKFLTSRVRFFDEMAAVKGIVLELMCDDDFNINMSEYELERVVDNTLSNAIKYSNEDGIVEIVLSFSEKKALLRIRDYGIGIDTEDVFLPYVQQDKKSLGLGLGLTIVKEICQKNGIKVELNSKLDSGSEFIYDLTKILDRS